MICVSSDFYWILQDILINVIATLMMSAELATYDLYTITAAMEKNSRWTLLAHSLLEEG